MDQKVFFLNGPAGSSPSTLLIPLGLLKAFNSKVAEFGSKANLFHFVANAKHPELKRSPRPGTAKICYQPEGLNLQRIDFCPNSEDWERFRTYAYYRRVSITLLFVILLLAWDAFESDSIVVPINPERISINQTLTIGKAYSYLELQHLIL